MVSMFAGDVFAYDTAFSCPYGKEGACLAPDDMICSSPAKCVSSDTVCFDSNTCDSSGFICNSQYKTLETEYNEVAGICRTIAAEFDDLEIKHGDLVNEHNDLLRRQKIIKICVVYASTIEEAQSCY